MSRLPAYALCLLPLVFATQANAAAAKICAKPIDCIIPETDGFIPVPDLLGNKYLVPFDSKRQEGYDSKMKAWDTKNPVPMPPPGVDEGTFLKAEISCYSTWFFGPKGLDEKFDKGPRAISWPCFVPQG